MSAVRNVLADQTRFLLRTEGDDPTGTPVLLLHGVPETSSAWREVAPHLAVGRRVLVPDLPGLGGSRYAGPFDVPSLVRQLAALIELESPGRPVDVVGHDWGGTLALVLAGERPDLVRRLCVANAPYRTIPLLRAFHIPLFTLPGVPELVFRLGGARVIDAMLDYAWRSDRTLDPVVRAEYRAAYTDPDKVAAMLAYYRGVTRPRLARLVERRPAEPRPPVLAAELLVLWGAKDPVLPISTGESVVKDLGARCRMVTVPEVGHFVLEEAPELVLEVLKGFLADPPPTAPAPVRRVRRTTAPS